MAEARRVSDVTLVNAEADCGDLDKALTLLDRMIAMDPDNGSLHQFRPALQYWRGDKAAALAGWTEIAESRGTLPMIAGGYGLHDQLRFTWLLQQSGRQDMARAELAKAERDLASREGTATELYAAREWERGLMAFLRGERGEALEHFQAAIDDGYNAIDNFDDPMLAPLAGDPQFEALRRQLRDKLDAEREKALVMICTDNPVPDHWQPLAETCADVPTARNQG